VQIYTKTGVFANFKGKRKKEKGKREKGYKLPLCFSQRIKGKGKGKRKKVKGVCD